MFTHLTLAGKDPDLLERRLYAAIQEVYLNKEGALTAAVNKYQSKGHFFEMVRVDFVVDDDLKVYLMEVKSVPCEHLSCTCFYGQKRQRRLACSNNSIKQQAASIN